MQAFYAHWDAHKIAPDRTMMDTLLHQRQKCEPMLDVMSEYDKHAEDLEQVPVLNLDMYLDQRKEDYEKYKLNRVLSLATDITVGAVPMNDKAKSIYTGPRDAMKYLHQSFQEGILLDDTKSQGGDTATEGIKSVARRIAQAAEGYGNVISTLTPIDAAMAIGPEASIKYVGIVGFSNQRKSTLLFTLAYQAAERGYKVLFIPRECSVVDAWMRFVWLHAEHIGRIRDLPRLSDATNPRKLTRQHAKIIAEIGTSMEAAGIRIDVRDCGDWGSISGSVNAHVDDPYDLLCVDYIAHLDVPGERDQREGIRGVYRKAQALSLDYERGRGLVVMTPVQANKSAEKVAAEPEPPLEKGVYRRGDIGAIEWHTGAGQDMDAVIGIWSAQDFAAHGLARISCIKSRQLFFEPFFMRVDEASQKMTYITDGEAQDILGGYRPAEAAPQSSLMKQIADMAACV